MTDQIMTRAQFGAVMNRADDTVLDAWYPFIASEFRANGIDIDPEQAAILASIANETGGMRVFDEASYYNTSNSRIIDVFSGVHDLTLQRIGEWKKLNRHDFDIAFFNWVYDDANRPPGYGLGNTHPGDGYRYRGMGPGATTGLGNYRWMAMELGLPLVEDPESVKTPAVGAKILCHFWVKNHCNEHVADGSEAGFMWAMRKLNAGLKDFSSHLAYWRLATMVMANDDITNVHVLEPRTSAQKKTDVRSIQIKLMEFGYNTGGIDGIAGPKTNAAILAFQRDRGLTVDGVVGPQTMAALGFDTRNIA